MPTTIEFVFGAEDEKHFLTFLEQFELTIYPDRIPPAYRPVRAGADALAALTDASCYLAAEKLGEIQVRTVKRGKDRGYLEIDEIHSPVIHYDRSLPDEDGQLRSGKLWTELNLTGDMQRNPALTDAFRRVVVQIRDYMVTRLHKSRPAGFLIGPQAARLSKAGTVLREQGRKGEELWPYR